MTLPQHRANLALGFAVAATVVWIAAGAIDDALYLLLPVFGIAAVAAGRGVRDWARAVWAMRAGAFFTLLFLAFLVVAIVTGDFE